MITVEKTSVTDRRAVGAMQWSKRNAERSKTMPNAIPAKDRPIIVGVDGGPHQEEIV
ncbi:hypothetical protein ACLGIH_00185 [Streptomyces sp. HMX87]|uniref:hypothetical protein n=1 Tax=Streptomyces sp. HMX87 TaxID=3390849 RepID=UPI003A8AEBED